MSEPGFCPSCGEVLPLLDELREQLAIKEEALQGLERELRAKRSQISRMRGDRDQQQLLDPHFDQASEVFTYWQKLLSPNAREFSGARFENVVARLRAGTPVSTIKRGIDGCKLKPYVVAGRRSERGQPDQRYCDLELICREEKNLASFIAIYDAHEIASVNGHEFPEALLAKRIARMQISQISELSLIGYQSLDEPTAEVVATGLELAARSVLEQTT